MRIRMNCSHFTKRESTLSNTGKTPGSNMNLLLKPMNSIQLTVFKKRDFILTALAFYFSLINETIFQGVSSGLCLSWSSLKRHIYSKEFTISPIMKQ